MDLWVMQLIGISVLAILLRTIEKKAAMRGCNRNPMPAWLDRSFRFVFLMMGPTAFKLDRDFFPIPIAIPALLLYMVTYVDLCEQHGGRDNLIARKWSFWNIVKRRLHLKLVKTVDLPEASYIIGVHPHGVLPFGAMIALSTEGNSESSFQTLFPKVNFRVLAATFCYYIPLYRDLLLLGGAVDAARYSAHHILTSGKSLALCPGGATEALYCDNKKDVVYLKKRTGFVRLALETGASLNECNTYNLFGLESPLMDRIKTKFQRIFGISLPLVKNIWPLRSHVTVVVGKPIPVPRIPEPTSQDIDKYLQLYIKSLSELYEENREKYNEPKTKPPLTII